MKKILKLFGKEFEASNHFNMHIITKLYIVKFNLTCSGHLGFEMLGTMLNERCEKSILSFGIFVQLYNNFLTRCIRELLIFLP